jgi:Uma2 family endonuclease
MRTVVTGLSAEAVEQLARERASSGLGLFDELWNGEYHMNRAPHGRHAYVDGQLALVLGRLAVERGLLSLGPFNLGEAGNYRVPDRGLVVEFPDAVYISTAALVAEIVSPDDETFAKLPFFAAHDVDEMMLVDPIERVLSVMKRVGDHYEPTSDSTVLGCSVQDIATAMRWA